MAASSTPRQARPLPHSLYADRVTRKLHMEQLAAYNPLESHNKQEQCPPMECSPSLPIIEPHGLIYMSWRAIVTLCVLYSAASVPIPDIVE